MKVIFLDADGVLNCASTTDSILNPDGTIYKSGGVFVHAWLGLDEDKMVRLARIIEATDAKIVLSTTWRRDPISTLYLLKRMGEKVASQVIGKTPDSDGRAVRKEEIEAWIQEHPGITQFAVLDDLEYDKLEDFGRSFIQTSSVTGLQDRHVERCIEVLGKKEG
jgi:hypothetical protein